MHTYIIYFKLPEINRILINFKQELCLCYKHTLLGNINDEGNIHENLC